MSSSTTTALSRQPLVQVLRNVADPRDRRGVRHDLPTVLSLAVAGVLAGARSLTAIWEHTSDLTAADLDAHLMTWFYTRTGTINGRKVITARRQDHAWSSSGASVGASPPVRPGPGHRRHARPGGHR